MFSFDQVVPATIACSQGGNIVAVAFTDEKIRVIDFRIPTSAGEAALVLEHTDMIKQICLSNDGTLCLSSGQDCMVRVWDLGTRRCI